MLQPIPCLSSLGPQASLHRPVIGHSAHVGIHARRCCCKVNKRVSVIVSYFLILAYSLLSDSFYNYWTTLYSWYSGVIYFIMVLFSHGIVVLSCCMVVSFTFTDCASNVAARLMKINNGKKQSF